MEENVLIEIRKRDEKLYEEREKLMMLIESYNNRLYDLENMVFVKGFNRLDLRAKKIEL